MRRGGENQRRGGGNNQRIWNYIHPCDEGNDELTDGQTNGQQSTQLKG